MLGYLANVQGLSVPEVTDSGTGLAFIAFPTAISQLPALNAVFGVIFFITLLTLGIDSAFALQEAFTTGFGDKWRIPPEKLARVFVLIAFPLSLIFVTRGGYYWFDIVDKWICDFGLVISGLIQCLVIGFLYPVDGFRDYLNGQSEVRIGRWWIWALRYVTPTVLTVILIGNFITELTESYEGYPRWATLIGGWGTLLFWLVLGYFLWKRPPKPDRS
jgi:NSS family neurotransmitter:Na+ symporter